MSPWAEVEISSSALLAVERENIALTGYGVKGFVLSMIETALSLSQEQCEAWRIRQILQWGQEMLDLPVKPLPGIVRTLTALEDSYRLILITKGDLAEQQRKITKSGLSKYLWKIEIVPEKDAEAYQRILQRHGIELSEFIMVGNSVPSDVLPVLAIGAKAIHIPHATTWALETAGIDETKGLDYPVLDSFDQLPAFLGKQHY